VPIRDFSAKYAVMQSSMTAAERIFALLDLRAGAVPSAARAGRVRGEIVFDHVWFAYRGEDVGAARRLVPVAAGERVAIVGATGSGKTTHHQAARPALRRAARAHPGRRHRRARVGPRALRRRIAVVLQDVFLFSGTVEDNITLGRDEIARAAVEAAAAHVNADRFIRASAATTAACASGAATCRPGSAS
jgi:ABC-type multidrug transport system fused ATPase/permease subunit